MKNISVILKNHFTKCFLSEEQTEGRLIAVNEKYLAMSWINKGQILLFDTSNSKDIKLNSLYFGLNNSNILDLEFSPFYNNILASAYSDNSVLFWNIHKEGLFQNITYSIYNKHKNKVNFLNFNPIASDVICSRRLMEIFIFGV